jgi:Uma2 family endonuclease
MPLAQKIIPHYTYDDYVHWEGRWELIEGHPIAMSPLPTPRHQRITIEIGSFFIFAIKKSGCRKCKVYDPIDYKIEEDTIVQPDVLIVCTEIKKAFLDFPPTLVVEVLSPSTAIRDKHTKYDIYQQQGVKYYLIVDADKKSIEIYMLESGAYVLQSAPQNKFDFFLDDDCSVTIDFNELSLD